MADDGAQGLDVHPVLQGGGGKGVPQIMEPQTPALRPLQYRLEPLSDGGRVHGGVLLHGRGEHPPGVDALLIGLEHVQDRGGEEHGPITRSGLGQGHHQFAPHPVDLPLHPQSAGPEIQVAPPEGQDLAPAQAGGQLQQ